MTLHRTTGFVASLLLLLASCSAPPVSREAAESIPYVISRDSVFRYSVPEGWFDATRDSSQSNRVVWIVRSDYAGTIFIREVYLDDAARKGLTRGGLMSIARLTSSLEAASRRGMVVLEPRGYDLRGGEACQYEMDERGEDRVRTVLLNVSGTLYAISSMASLSLPEETRRSIVSTHDAFISTLRWTPKQATSPMPSK
jgi:hypothetical protein